MLDCSIRDLPRAALAIFKFSCSRLASKSVKFRLLDLVNIIILYLDPSESHENTISGYNGCEGNSARRLIGTGKNGTATKRFL
jgi:hypothetical protein